MGEANAWEKGPQRASAEALGVENGSAANPPCLFAVGASTTKLGVALLTDFGLELYVQGPCAPHTGDFVERPPDSDSMGPCAPVVMALSVQIRESTAVVFFLLIWRF